MSLMELELEHEKHMLKKIINSGRKDAIAKILHNSIEKKICNLQRAIDGTTRKENASYADRCKISHLLDATSSSHGFERNKDYYSIPAIYS